MLFRRDRTELSHVAFEVTSKCNLDCRYCYNPWKRPGGRLTAAASHEQVMRTLRRLFNTARVGQLTLTGGEPLLAERVLEVALFCRLKGASVNVITNGSGAGPGDYETLVSLGVRLFELPVHSPTPEVHDELARKPGAWQCSVQSLRELQELGARAVAVIVVTRLNAHLVSDTLAYLRELGIREVMLNRFNVGGTGITERPLIEPTHEQLRSAFAAADRFAFDHDDMRLSSNVCSPMCVLSPTDFPRIRFSACATDPRRMPLTLDAAGNLRLCNHSPTPVGNLFESSLEQMFASNYARAWRETVPELCNDCDHWSRCRGGCRAAAEQLGGNLLDADPAVGTLKRASAT